MALPTTPEAQAMMKELARKEIARQFCNFLRAELEQLSVPEWREYRRNQAELMRSRKDLDLIEQFADGRNFTDARVRLLVKGARRLNELEEREAAKHVMSTNKLFGRF
jgi:transcriptional regulator of heat shock response